ncbi:hypothetical protein [Methylopila sp. 73B]|uniref:hypothetical protein n=1 Tax=Methylopila sp. 73B TaxID=1120792 RepID=UPI000360A4B8|nr:hypothetical protein [Methylopila sp. 73B]
MSRSVDLFEELGALISAARTAKGRSDGEEIARIVDRCAAVSDELGRLGHHIDFDRLGDIEDSDSAQI